MTSLDKSMKTLNIEKSPTIDETTKKKELDGQSKEQSKGQSKGQSKEQELIQLKLGQFIQIDAPGNENLNEKEFYINYLDNDIIDLINSADNTHKKILINNGNLSDESIKAISILYSPDVDGYARQNGLVTGEWFTIEFGGEVPTLINGQITNLENDMIEFSIYGTDDKIYIDFGYKGIPKNLPIIEIRPFDEPKTKTFTDDIPDISNKDDISMSYDLTELKKSQDEQLSSEFLKDKDEFEDDFNYEDDEKKSELQKILEDGVNIILVKDEAIEYVDEYVEVESSRRKYPIKFQVNDMMDALLAEYPTAERNKKVVNNIHTIINRFKDLRLKYSDFSKDGMINSIKKVKKNYKPLVDNLLNFNNDLYWLIPVVKNKKKLYDLDLLEDSIDDDILLNTTEKFINDYNSVVTSYYKNAVPDDSKKYAYIQNQINNVQSVSQPPSNTTNIINKIKINENTHALIDNLDEMNSSSVNNDRLSQKRFALQKYITGENMLYANPLIKRKIYEQKKIIQNETLFLKGFIIMSKYFMELTKLKLKSSNIYKKVLLHNNLLFHDVLENYDLFKYYIDEDFQEIPYKTTFLKEPIEVSFVEERKFSERNNNDMYEKFLDKMIPTTEKIIQNIKGHLKYTTNNVTFLKELEPFLIYYENLTFPQYNLMNDIIIENIAKYKKILANKLLENKPVERPINSRNFFDELFSANETVNEAYQEILRVDEEVRQAELKEGEAADVKDGEEAEVNEAEEALIKEEGKLEKKILSLNVQLNQLYGFEGKNMSNTDIIREIYNLDGGHLMNTYIGLLQIDMRESLNLQEKLQKEITNADEKMADGKMQDIDQCKNFVLTKTYNDIALLQEDNNKEFIFYDSKYDNTPYDIVNEFLREKRDMGDDEFKNLLKEHLIKNVGVKPKIAERDSESMVIGQKRIVNGEFAVLDLGDYEYRYYERINNEWRLKDEYNDKMPDDSMFCNIKDKCLKINNNCADNNEHNMKIHNVLVNEIIENFSKELEKSNEDIKKELTKKKKELTKYLIEKIQFNNKEFLKKNNLMVNLTGEIAREELKISPYLKILMQVLSQKNHVQKYNDVLLFYNSYCRPYEKTNNNESIHWFYCVDTNYPLMPTYLLSLAQSYKNNTFQSTLNKIVKKRGILSDDGDKVVDKYSGYTIKYIDLDIAEGYNVEGYKIKSRDLIKNDEGDMIMKMANINDVPSRTKLEKLIYTILMNLDKTIGVNLSSSHDFIFENTLKVLNNLIPEEIYERKKKKAAKMNKKLKAYDMIVNEKIIFSIMALYVVVTQSSIPPVKTSKTFPGCKRNFSGWPLNEHTNNGFIEYIICVCLKIKNDSRPWVALPKIRQNKDKKSNEKLNKFIIRFKKFFEQEILSIYEVTNKLEFKREWLKNNIEEFTNLNEFNIRNWSTFLPPLNPIDIDRVKMIGDSISQKLESTIRKRDGQQFKIINKIKGKMMELSMYIIKNINNVIKTKDKLFVTNSGLPYTENACCNDSNYDTYEYFIRESNIIDRDVINVSKLLKIIKRVNKLNKAKLMFSEKNTKILPNKIKNNFTEETIFRAFIKYCKYNTGLGLNPELQSLCIKNNSKFTNTNTIQEKIEIIKKENGDIYNEKSLELLMKYFHRQNMIDITFNKEIVNKHLKFKEILKYLSNKPNVKICNKEIIPKILNLVDKYAMRYKKKENDERDELLLFIEEDTKTQLNNIFRFFKKNLRKDNSKIVKFLKKFIEYEMIGTDMYMKNNDETAFLIGNQIKNMIKNLCNLFPKIILEKVDYKMYVPEHWKLSIRHIKDVENMIYEEYSGFKQFYDNTDLIKLLNFIRTNTEDLMLIIENIPFFAAMHKTMDSVINDNVYIKLHEYFFICTISLYIKLLNEMTSKSSLDNIGEFKSMELSVEDTLIKGINLDNLEKNVANLLKEFIKIFIKRKKLINLSNEKIEKNILKAKEKEKDRIRLNLKNLTVESRKIEDVMKNHKLGRWGFGESRAVFEYDADQYEKELMEIEKIALMEKRAGISDDVTNANMEILQFDDTMLDYLEEDIINKREMFEVNMLDSREEGELDGEEMW